MAKGKFSAQDWKVWIAKNRHERFEGEELVVGVDCAKVAFYAAVMTGSWHTFDVIYFVRDEIGEMLDRLEALPFKKVVLVVEPTGTYSDPLISQARERGMEVVRINGEKVSSADRAFDGVPSLHDGKAAYLLGRLYFCGVGTLWNARSEEDRDLRALVNMNKITNDLMQRLVGPLEAYLARHWPELTSFLALTSATLLELLIEYGSPQAVAAHRREAAALMRKVGGNMLSQEKIDAVVASASSTLGVLPTSQEMMMLKHYAGLARDIQKHDQKAQLALEQAALADERTKPLVGFCGKRTAAIIVAFLGSLTDYESWAQVEKALGLNLCERSTGQTREDKQQGAKGLHISKRGSPEVRAMLYFLALRMLNPRSTSYCREAVAWYGERLRANGGCKIKAVTALMRKIVRALWWVARGEEFDGCKLFDVPRLKRLGYLGE
jgi:transposase